jgi:hypothetical protein
MTGPMTKEQVQTDAKSGATPLITRGSTERLLEQAASKLAELAAEKIAESAVALHGEETSRPRPPSRKGAQAKQLGSVTWAMEPPRR